MGRLNRPKGGGGGVPVCLLIINAPAQELAVIGKGSALGCEGLCVMSLSLRARQSRQQAQRGGRKPGLTWRSGPATVSMSKALMLLLMGSRTCG